MASPSDCRTMRDVMKSVFIRILVIFFWITIAVLGVILFWHVGDITFSAISKLNFLKSQFFYYVVIGLSSLSIVLGVFMAICSFVAEENETVSVTFFFFSIIGFAMPLIGDGFILILSCFYPDNAVPQTLKVLADLGTGYFMVIVTLVFTASAIFGASRSY